MSPVTSSAAIRRSPSSSFPAAAANPAYHAALGQLAEMAVTGGEEESGIGPERLLQARHVVEFEAVQIGGHDGPYCGLGGRIGAQRDQS